MAHEDAPRHGTVTLPFHRRPLVPRRPLMLLITVVLGLIPAVVMQVARPTRAAASPVQTSIVNGVASPASGGSVAVGEYVSGGPYATPYGMIDMQSGGVWLPYQVPMPSGVNQNGSSLAAVSCPQSSTVCVAVGGYTDNSGNTQALIVSLSSGTWSAVTGPLPSGANSVPNAGLGASAVHRQRYASRQVATRTPTRTSRVSWSLCRAGRGRLLKLPSRETT